MCATTGRMKIQPVCDWFPLFWLPSFFRSSLPRHLLTICFVFSLLFPLLHQSFQGMLSSLHSELDIQRYLMKIQLLHTVSQPFLYLTCILACVCSFLHVLTFAWPPSFFFFFFSPDALLFVPVKTYSDALLNRFALRNLPQVSEKVNKST